MKKLFLIPLMTLVCSVMAWGDNEAKIGDTEYATLKAALDAAPSGATIELLKDVSYTDAVGTANLNINKSLTLDGKGHTITGYSRRSGKSQYATIWINLVSPSASNVTVIFKDVKVVNPYDAGYSSFAIQTRGMIDSIAIVDSYLEADGVPFQIGGSQSSKAKITMINSQLKARTYYCLLSYNPYILKAENCEFRGWNALYFKGVDGSAGSRGSEITLTDCTLNCPNIYDTPTNSFAMFVCEDDGISITLNNCGMHAEQLGNQTQTVLMLSNFASKTRRSTPVSLTITGDNSYINGKLVSYSGWASGYYYNAPSDAAIPDPCPLSITISGGTYAFNPANQGWLKNQTYETEEELYDESNIGKVTIPDGYEVKEITTQQGGLQTKLYRVRKTITTAYSINDDAESQGKGQNKNTEFLIQANETVNVPTDTVIANYVEVSNNATLTVPDGTQLEVTNGLDVTEGAKVVIEAGSTVIVGEGGVTSKTTESIVITADENGSASFLLSPEVIVNTTPNLTVKMKAKAIGYDIDEEKEYYWFRFAAPVAGITELGKDKDRPTYIYKWNYGANEWSSISGLHELTPFLGYTLTTEYEKVDTDADDVEYTFHGQLAGNQNTTLQFQNRGFNYFGNSYTGYISVLALVEQLMDAANIDGTVYMWDNAHQKFVGTPLAGLRDNPSDYADWQKEVAPMQTFILRQINTGETLAATELNYASAIWGNPRYGRVSTPAPAPRRQVSNDDAAMTIVITATNGSEDEITLKEGADFSDEFNKGYDVVKFMNERMVNMYATVDGENYSTVATDNLEGKKISLQTVKSLNYTMSFANVRGNEYAIRDNVTGAIIAIEEGATYEFAAQPKSTIEGRFEIVSIAKVPTAIENANAVKANVKGIYTIMGQYLGEDFEALPAGIYVVDGVKIVK